VEQFNLIFNFIIFIATGEIFSMGSGRGGKLGDNIHDRYMPLKIGSLAEKKVVALACSELHSAVVTCKHILYLLAQVLTINPLILGLKFLRGGG